MCSCANVISLSLCLCLSIDAGRTSGDIAATQELIEASAWHMPWAQHLITYPLLNGDRPVELIRSIMATGMYIRTYAGSLSFIMHILLSNNIMVDYDG
jgi:hypothetical protein